MSRRPKRTYEEPFFEKGRHIKDLRIIIKEGIKIFFENKKWFAGGKIPQCELLSDSSVDVVLKTPFNESSFGFFHDCCLSKISCPKDFVDEGVPWEVCYLISLLREMKIYGLPKDFQPGFLMLFFKFCKGINIPQPPVF